MARDPLRPSAVGRGENPYGQITEYANGTDRDGAGSDGGWGFEWPSQKTPDDAQALRQYSRDTMRPKLPPEPDFGIVRRRRK